MWVFILQQSRDQRSGDLQCVCKCMWGHYPGDLHCSDAFVEPCTHSRENAISALSVINTFASLWPITCVYLRWRKWFHQWARRCYWGAGLRLGGQMAQVTVWGTELERLSCLCWRDSSETESVISAHAARHVRERKSSSGAPRWGGMSIIALQFTQEAGLFC